MRLPQFRSPAIIVAVLLSACGGALLAALPFVGPIGGFWSSAAGDHTLDFDGDTDYYQGFSLTRGATLNSPLTQCGGPHTNRLLSALLDEDRVTFSAPGLPNCLTGQFLDELTLRLDTGGAGTQLRNQRGFDPLFETGVWVNTSNDQQRLAFTLPVTSTGGVSSQAGCEYGAGARLGTVQVSFVPGNAATGARASVGPLVLTRSAGGTETWSNGRFRGASVLEIDTPSGRIALQRRDLTLACP